MEPTRNKQFADRQEFKAAIDLWIRDDCANNPDCRVSLRYGWPMNVWQVELVTDMSTLFRDQSFFNEKISDWEVSQVTNMNGMFEDTEEFNSDISTWNVKNVSRELSLLLHVQLAVYTLTFHCYPYRLQTWVSCSLELNLLTVTYQNGTYHLSRICQTLSGRQAQ